MSTFSSLAEVEDAIQKADPQTRYQTLHAVTDLFLDSCKQLGEEQIDLFDDVFEALLEGSECSAIVDMSRRLAPLENSPPRTVKRLASDDSIEVAGPMLQFSPRLTTSDLRELASTKDYDHLLAISKRRDLE